MATTYDKTDNYALNLYGDDDPADLRDGYNGSMRTIDTTLETHLGRIEKVESRETHDEEVAKALLGDNTVDDATAAKTRWDKAGTDATDAIGKADATTGILTALGTDSVSDASASKTRWDGAATAAADNRTAIERTDATLATIAPYAERLPKIGYNSARRFVIFGDSWTTSLAGVNIPEKAIVDSGAGIVRNYGVSGALLGTQSQTGTALNTQAQIDRAEADSTVDRSTVTDVLVLAGVNNVGGAWKPSYTEAQAMFNAFRIYPYARYWYVANNSRTVNLPNTAPVWNDWIPMFQTGAQSVGFATAAFSPFWTRDANWSSYWDGQDGANRHMNATGNTMFAGKLQAFLNGVDSIPTCPVKWVVDPTLSSKIGDFSIHEDASVFEGHKVHVYLTCTGSGDSGSTDLVSSLYTAAEFAPCYITQYLNCQYYSDGNLIFGGMATVKPDGHIYINGGALKDNKGFIVISGEYDIRY